MKSIKILFAICLLVCISVTCKKTNIEDNDNPDGEIPEISEAFFDLAAAGASVESYDISNGTATFSFSGEVPEISVGAIIAVDADTMGYLRKVRNTTISGNEVVVETELAYMDEVFVDIDFKLKTEMMEPLGNLKSSSTYEEISKALTDAEGYIHPVEIIYSDSLKNRVSRSIFDDESKMKQGRLPIIEIVEDFSKTDLYGNSESNIHYYIDEGSINFNADAVIEFDFDYDGEFDEDTKIKKGDLKTFRFYVEGSAGIKLKWALDMKAGYSKKGKKNIFDKDKVVGKYLVGTVPVWITFKADVFGAYSFNADAKIQSEWGFESTHTLQVGGVYNGDDESFEPFSSYEPVNNIYPIIISGEANLGIRGEIYPRLEVLFYSFFGPTIEIVPYVDGKYNIKTQSVTTSTGTKKFIAWNSSSDLGLDLRVGTKLSFLWGLWNKEFGPIDINCFKYTLWESPVNIMLQAVLPTEVLQNTYLEVKMKVTDDNDFLVRACPVYITGDGIFSGELVFTDENGEVNIGWMLPDKDGTAQFTAVIYDSEGKEIDKITQSISVKGAGNKAPSAVIMVDPEKGSPETSFSFNASACTDFETPASQLEVRWDWTGDGGWDTDYSTTKTASYTYSAVGSYSVKLEVRDEEGKTDTATKVVTVEEEEYDGTFDYQGKTYKYKNIGTQTWMAENMNYATGNSWCYGGEASNCETYGRLYDLETAKTVCPPGWRLPSDSDWTTLTSFLGTSSGTKMRSKIGWYNMGNGNNSSGFNAFPGGYYKESSGKYYLITESSIFWSATTASETLKMSWVRRLNAHLRDVHRTSFADKDGLSVRCVK